MPQSSYWLQQNTAELGQYLSGHFGPAAGQHLALGMIYRGAQQHQALLGAFIDIFRRSALIGLFAGVLAWTFRKVAIVHKQ